VTEGNYLLVDDGDWRHVHELLAEVWYVDPPDDERLRRLLDRHITFGRDAAAARDRTYGSDQRNAELVATTKHRADVVVLG